MDKIEINNKVVSRQRQTDISTIDIKDILLLNDELPATAEDILLVISKIALLKKIDIDSDRTTAICNELLLHNITKNQLLSAYEYILGINLYGSLNIEHFIADEALYQKWRITAMANRLIKEYIDNYNNPDYINTVIEKSKEKLLKNVLDDFNNYKSAVLNSFKEYLEKEIFVVNDAKLNLLINNYTNYDKHSIRKKIRNT